MDMVGNITFEPTQKGTALFHYAQTVGEKGVQAITDLKDEYFLDDKFCYYIVWRYVSSAKERIIRLLHMGKTVDKNKECLKDVAIAICEEKRARAKENSEKELNS